MIGNHRFPGHGRREVCDHCLAPRPTQIIWIGEDHPDVDHLEPTTEFHGRAYLYAVRIVCMDCWEVLHAMCPPAPWRVEVLG